MHAQCSTRTAALPWHCASSILHLALIHDADPSSDRHAIDALRAGFQARVADARTEQALKALQDEFLGRKSGSVPALMKTLGGLPPEAKRDFGALVNTLKAEVEATLEEKRQSIHAARPIAGAVDVTLPGRVPPLGRVHPLMRVRQEVEDIFMRMGYEILEGPEVEDDFHNFEALNMPPDHPARDMQDTLYLTAPIVGSTWGAHRRPCPTRRSAPRRCSARIRRRCRSAT